MIKNPLVMNIRNSLIYYIEIPSKQNSFPSHLLVWKICGVLELLPQTS
jgi:hypothetical protein